MAIAMDTEGKTDDRLLDEVQRETFDFFLVETNERNGLVADCTRPMALQHRVHRTCALLLPGGRRRCSCMRSPSVRRRVQYEYATANPRQFDYYNAFCWGITAGDGPGPARFEIGGVQRAFLGYAARGAPFGPDDGTFSPWVVVASLPFAPEVVPPTIRHIENHRSGLPWRLMRGCRYIADGLRRAGFEGGRLG